MLTDPIADMLTRIRNAQVARHDLEVLVLGGLAGAWYRRARRW